MTDTPLPPQGDRFEDQYTSATADLSAGGVATSFQSEPATYTPITEPRSAEMRGIPTQDPVASTRGQTWPEADTRGERIEAPARAESFRYPASQPSYVPPPAPGTGAPTLPIAMAVGLAILSAIGGAWLYARWQRRQHRRFRL